MKSISEIAKNIDSILQEKNITKAAYTVSERETGEFNTEGTEFTLLRTLFDNNLSVTVFSGKRKGVVAGNDLSDAGIRKLVEDAVAAAEASEEDPAYDLAPAEKAEVFRKGPYEPDNEKLFSRIKEFNETVSKDYPKILMMQSFGKHIKSHSLYVNTNGTAFETYEGCYLYIAEFAGHDGDKTTGINSGYVVVSNLDKPFIEYESMRMHLEESVKQLDIKPMEGKFTGTVVLTPDCAEQLMMSIIGNYASGRTILDGTSQWKDKIGEKVADERITLMSDPFHPELPNSECYTSDGFKAVSLPIIENGVLKNFVLDLYVANKTGKKPSKNSGGDMVLKAGDTSYADIIKGIKKGIMIGGFSGGEPGANGEFSGVAKNAFLIENGEITTAVNETMFSGNLGEMINNVYAISKETVSSGASVFPYLAVNGITISGK